MRRYEVENEIERLRREQRRIQREILRERLLGAAMLAAGILGIFTPTILWAVSASAGAIALGSIPASIGIILILMGFIAVQP